MGRLQTSDTLTAKFPLWNHGLIEFKVTPCVNDFLVASVVDNNAGVTPSEFIHAPERVNREEEAVDGIPVKLY